MGRQAKNPINSMFYEDLRTCALFYGYKENEANVVAAKLVVTECRACGCNLHTGHYARMFICPKNFSEARMADVNLDSSLGAMWPDSFKMWADKLGIKYP